MFVKSFEKTMCIIAMNQHSCSMALPAALYCLRMLVKLRAEVQNPEEKVRRKCFPHEGSVFLLKTCTTKMLPGGYWAEQCLRILFLNFNRMPFDKMDTLAFVACASTWPILRNTSQVPGAHDLVKTWVMRMPTDEKVKCLLTIAKMMELRMESDRLESMLATDEDWNTWFDSMHQIGRP